MTQEAVVVAAVPVDSDGVVAGVERLCTLGAVQHVVGEDARVGTPHWDCGTALALVGNLDAVVDSELAAGTRGFAFELAGAHPAVVILEQTCLVAEHLADTLEERIPELAVGVEPESAI